MGALTTPETMRAGHEGRVGKRCQPQRGAGSHQQHNRHCDRPVALPRGSGYRQQANRTGQRGGRRPESGLRQGHAAVLKQRGKPVVQAVVQQEGGHCQHDDDLDVSDAQQLSQQTQR